MSEAKQTVVISGLDCPVHTRVNRVVVGDVSLTVDPVLVTGEMETPVVVVIARQLLLPNIGVTVHLVVGCEDRAYVVRQLVERHSVLEVVVERVGAVRAQNEEVVSLSWEV